MESTVSVCDGDGVCAFDVRHTLVSKCYISGSESQLNSRLCV